MIRILVISLFLLVNTFLSAQVVSFVKYGVENGLIQSQVQAFEQDDYGRLWVGTISGISVYDGVYFNNLTTKDSLAENWVTAMLKTKNGDMWIGHRAGSISRWSKETNEIENVSIERYNEFQTITQFVEDTAKNIIVFSTNGSGLFIYNVETNVVEKVLFTESTEAKFISTLYLDKFNNLWVGTANDGVYVIQGDDLKGQDVPSIHLNDINGLSSNKIKDIEFFNEEIWIATADQGLSKLNQDQIPLLMQNNNISEITFDFTNADGRLTSNKLSSLQSDGKGNLWIGTHDKGALRVVLKGGKLYFQSYGTRQGLSFYDINCIFLDREHSVWLGTNVGVNQYVSDYFLLYDKSIGLKSNMILSVCSNGKGNMVLGTNQGVSMLINGTNTDNDELKVQDLKIQGLDDKRVTDIFKDSEDNLWYSTADGLLFKQSADGGFQKVNIENVLQDFIFCIQEDDQGNIWLGTRLGAARLNKKTYNLDFYGEEQGLGGTQVSKIAKDTHGNLWFACSGGYLTMYNGESFKVFREEDGVKPLILCVTADKLGNVYFGAYTGGLYKYDGSEFTNYSAANTTLRTESPYALVADDKNNIWIGTSYGVEKFDPRTEQFTHYGKTEGFLGLEVNYNSICTDENDNVWFGCILGAVKYNPSVDFENVVKPIVTLQDLEVDQQPAEFPFDSEFKPEQNNLTFKYTGVSLNNSNKVRYQYMLVGKDTGWSRQSEFRQVYYSNLNPGDYNLMIKAINGHKTESKITEYVFSITTPFYQSYTFYLIQVIVIVVMLTAAVFYGRKTGGSRVSTVLATIALIIVFEYGINYVEDNIEGFLGNVAFIKVGLNVLLGLMLFPIEVMIKKMIIKDDVEGDSNDDSSDTEELEGTPS